MWRIDFFILLLKICNHNIVLADEQIFPAILSLIAFRVVFCLTGLNKGQRLKIFCIIFINMLHIYIYYLFINKYIIYIYLYYIFICIIYILILAYNLQDKN